jgi:hypothetical protein
VNFFGHAAAACVVDDDPAFLLGAMAPDLLPLCGAVADAETSPRVVAGQAHHASVDAIFHCNPAFTSLQAWASRSLIALGVPRGGARGAAHVGIELFLDGELARRGRARDAYARSLDGADTVGVPFVWRDDRSRARWAALIARLRTGAVPDAYRDPDFVADRLIGALSHRPRLALSQRDAGTLRAFLPELGARVAARAAGLVADLALD